MVLRANMFAAKVDNQSLIPAICVGEGENQARESSFYQHCGTCAHTRMCTQTSTHTCKNKETGEVIHYVRI